MKIMDFLEKNFFKMAKIATATGKKVAITSQQRQ